MNPLLERLQAVTRRQFLRDGSLGLGGLALASMLGDARAANAPRARNTDPLAPKQPHFPARAKRVIYLHMSGAPPHLDLLDYKPELVKRDGQNCPDEFLAGRRFAFTSGVPKLLGTPRTFKQHGEGGVWMSDALPHLHSVADELCVIRSMFTEQFNHAPAELLLYTGSARSGRPSLGSWVTYGLGTENENLPGFVVLISSGVQPNGGKNSFGSGFLPSVFQGVQCRSQGDPVLYASDPEGMDRDLRRLFSSAAEHKGNAKASRFIHRIRKEVRRLVSEWTGTYQYTIDRVIEDIVVRCDELNLRLRYPEDRTKLDFMMLVAVQTMNYLHSGRHRLAL